MIFKCVHCGNEFTAKKETALYCSNSHRTAANKQRRYYERNELARKQEQLDEQERKKQKAEAKKKERAEKAMLVPIEKVNNVEVINSAEFSGQIETDLAASNSDSNQKERALTETALTPFQDNILKEATDTHNNSPKRRHKSRFLRNLEIQQKFDSAKKATKFNIWDFFSNIRDVNSRKK